MTQIRWTPYNLGVTYLSTELTGVIANANKLGAAIDFTATGYDRKLYLDIEFVIGSMDLSGQTNPCINLWMLGRTDGTNFADGSDTVDPAPQPDMIIPLRAFNGVQRVLARGLLTTPDQGKILIENGTGVTLAAGSTLKFRMYSEQSV